MSNLSTIKMTSKQYLMMGEDPPGVRLELAHGEIVVSPSPTPGHSSVVVNLVRILGNHIHAKKLGQLFADTDTIFDDENTRRPDIAYFSAARRNLIGPKALMGPPNLCIEVLSPSNEEMDRDDKFALYEKRRVANYWIIDQDARVIEAYVLKRGTFVLTVAGKGKAVVHLPPFADLAIRLREVWPED